MIARRSRTNRATRKAVRCPDGIEVEARRRVQEARPVAQGKTSGEAPEAGREQAEPQGLGSEIADGRAWAIAALSAARIGRLGTVGPTGAVRLVPICFATDGRRIVSAVDHKPKSTPSLARLGDIERTGRATLLVDHYDDDDWSALWWVRVEGAASVHSPTDPQSASAVAALIEKYAQYRETPPAGSTYSIEIESLTWWRASP
jgi:PPOX class probable F420-dependent enzyme